MAEPTNAELQAQVDELTEKLANAQTRLLTSETAYHDSIESIRESIRAEANAEWSAALDEYRLHDSLTQIATQRLRNPDDFFTHRENWRDLPPADIKQHEKAINALLTEKPYLARPSTSFDGDFGIRGQALDYRKPQDANTWLRDQFDADSYALD